VLLRAVAPVSAERASLLNATATRLAGVAFSAIGAAVPDRVPVSSKRPASQDSRSAAATQVISAACAALYIVLLTTEIGNELAGLFCMAYPSFLVCKMA
jgi:hypothetical protein